MSGILFVLAEILIFMVAATAIGFFLGKWLSTPGPTDVELVEEVERLERELVEEVIGSRRSWPSPKGRQTVCKAG